MTLSQPVGLVIFLIGLIFLWNFCYRIVRSEKITKVNADERINAEMKSLFILFVGGRGQPMIAGKRGGEYGTEKFNKLKKLGLLQKTKYFMLVDKKCTKLEKIRKSSN